MSCHGRCTHGQQADVRGYTIANTKTDNITRNELICKDDAQMTISDWSKVSIHTQGSTAGIGPTNFTFASGNNAALAC